MIPCDHGSAITWTISLSRSTAASALLVMVGRQDRARSPGTARVLAGNYHDLCAVRRLQHRAGERALGRAEGHLAPVQAQHGVPPARLLDVMRCDHHPSLLLGEAVDEPHQPLGARLVDAGKRL